MAFNTISDNIKRLNDSIRSFAESTAEYYKLELFNKSMKGATALAKALVLGFFLLFFIAFISLALSVLISNAIGVPSSGFFIVAGFYLLLFLFVLFIGGKYIEEYLLVKISRKYFEKSEKEEEEPDNITEDETI